MLGEIRGEVRFKEPLSFHTSLRIGGPVDFFVIAQDLDDARYAMNFAAQEGLPLIVLGGGNNLLVSAEGVRGVVLQFQGVLGRAEFNGDEVAAGAGVSLSALIREAAARDLGGIECLAGIPSSIGGALACNAGTRDGAILDFCSAVYFLYPDGTLGEVRPLGHVSSPTFDFPPGAVYVGCRMRLVRRPEEQIRKDVHQRLKPKKAAQPVAMASAGRVWKNSSTEHAERLISAVGLRGKRMNGAEISAKHANFIVNRGGAAATDIKALMQLTLDRVRNHFGITLEPVQEAAILGDVFSHCNPHEREASHTVDGRSPNRHDSREWSDHCFCGVTNAHMLQSRSEMPCVQ